MCRAFLGLLLSVSCLGFLSPVFADENSDLNLIPGTVQDAGSEKSAGDSPKPAAAAHGRYYSEDAATVSSRRDDLIVPFPSPAPFDWQNRTSLDATDTWRLTERLTATYSDRFNITGQSGVAFPTSRNERNDFREGYVTWQPAAENYLEAGRINVRNGVALGFNPTDYFKTRSLLDQSSLDPSVIRQDRLGTAMVEGQTLWDGFSASLAYAPKLYAPTRVDSGLQFGLNPRFDRTNAANRFLLSSTYDIADLSPQALVYHEGTVTKFGLNLSRPLSQSVVGYLEWSGGRQQDLIARAVEYGKRTGTLPAAAPFLPATDLDSHFQNDVAIGASWSSEAKITINLEYHYHEAGFTNRDWQHWFAIGGAHPSARPIASELWFVRGFANDQQEPLTQQQVFIRADWTDAFVTDLELTALTFVDLYDGSMLGQLSATYNLSNAWTIAGFVSANVGRLKSERGSFPQEASAILQIARYF